MGTGKTTLGRALEEYLPGWCYIDLDEEIERRAGMTVTDIFARYGEEAFRRMERQTLADVSDTPRSIIGCGGGTPCFFDNMDLMNSRGVTVLLKASHATLLRRLLEAQARRPKLNGLSPAELQRYISDAIRARAPFYDKALHTFPSDLLENRSEIETSCRQFITTFISNANELPDPA